MSAISNWKPKKNLGLYSFAFLKSGRMFKFVHKYKTYYGLNFLELHFGFCRHLDFFFHILSLTIDLCKQSTLTAISKVTTIQTKLI
jgi:hypothetical protein